MKGSRMWNRPRPAATSRTALTTSVLSVTLVLLLSASWLLVGYLVSGVSPLLVAAERDDLGSVAGQRRLRETFPPQAQARLEVLPEVGHLIHYETPRRAGRNPQPVPGLRRGRRTCS